MLSTNALDGRELRRLAPGQPASWGALGRTYAKEVLHSVARLTLRRRRDRDFVSREYDLGRWRELGEARSWESYDTLVQFAEQESGRTICAKIGGRATLVDIRDYYRFRRSALARALDQLSGGDPHLVELGSGYGEIVFALALERPDYRLVGCDVSANGVRAARAIAAHFGVQDRVKFEQLDLLEPEHEGFGLITGRTVFTHFCLEQIPRETEQVVRNILAHRPRRVVHIEPTRELLRWWSPYDLLNALYVRSRDYQSDIFRALTRLEASGDIRVTFRGRLPFSPTLRNDGFVAVWEPARPSS
jgi:hypothetical protein